MLPDGTVAPCRLCNMVPECPGYILDENSVLANIRPKMLKAVVKHKSSPMDLKAEFENLPAPAFLSFTRRLRSIATGHETYPQWDKFPHRALVADQSTTDCDNCVTRKRTFMFPVQGPLDHLASFHKLKVTPSRVGFKSLVLFSSGDVLVAFGPLILEHTCVYNNCDSSMPSTNGKVKFSSIHVPYSSAPMPIMESEMHLVSADNAKVDKYMNLPPFSNFEKYARNKIGTLIINAHRAFVTKGYPIQFKPETLTSARAWMLETPDYANHRF